ncbi:MAG: SH3 domain-containing protein [Myxococcales bacterium]
MVSPDAPLRVHVPSPGDDRPSWVKVGVIAALGFVIGIVWPRLAGVRIGPNAPEHSSASARVTAPPAASSAPTPSFSTSAATFRPAPAPVLAAPPTVTTGHGFVLSCKTAEGDSKKGAACGSLAGFDGLVNPRVARLVQCPAADGVSGKLAVVFAVDFASNHIGMEAGRATTVPNPEPLIACLKATFQGAPLGGLDHPHSRYNLLYSVVLVSAGGDTPGKDRGDAVETKVVWEAGIVRDAPRTGQIVARLPRGSKVKVGPMKDGWYQVKYGTDLGSEGWIYRGAIGK